MFLLKYSAVKYVGEMLQSSVFADIVTNRNQKLPSCHMSVTDISKYNDAYHDFKIIIFTLLLILMHYKKALNYYITEYTVFL